MLLLNPLLDLDNLFIIFRLLITRASEVFNSDVTWGIDADLLTDVQLEWQYLTDIDQIISLAVLLIPNEADLSHQIDSEAYLNTIGMVISHHLELSTTLTLQHPFLQFPVVGHCINLLTRILRNIKLDLIGGTSINIDTDVEFLSGQQPADYMFLQFLLAQLLWIALRFLLNNVDVLDSLSCHFQIKILVITGRVIERRQGQEVHAFMILIFQDADRRRDLDDPQPVLSIKSNLFVGDVFLRISVLVQDITLFLSSQFDQLFP